MEQLTNLIVRLGDTLTESLEFYSIEEFGERSIEEAKTGPYNQTNFLYFFQQYEEVIF